MSYVRLAAFAGVLICTLPTSVFADDTGLASMHDQVKSGGKSCFTSHAHSGTGEGKTKPAAKVAAIKSWYAYTAGEYGSDWARWGKSAGQRVTYTKADAGWSATVESRPCK